MKKIFTAFLLLNFFGLLNINAAFALEDDFMVKALDKSLKIKQNKITNIEDTTAASLNPNLKIKRQQLTQQQDNFVNQTLDSSLKIKQYKNTPVADTQISGTKTSVLENRKKEILNHEIMGVALKVSPLHYYTTRNNLKEGQYIDFQLAQEVKIDNNTFKKGTPIKARVENVTTNGIYGLPSDLTIGNFLIADKVNIDSELTLKGANRAVWVYPAVYGTMWFFGAGLLFIPIRGGHAKLKPNKIYEIEI